jgi:hypothetical protein
LKGPDLLDPFRLCVALGPVVIYLFLLAAINLFRRPLLVSGTRDAATLGLAVSGLVLVGPVDLFLPVSTSIAFGPFVWVFVIALYALALALMLLLLRPRLVVYNISAQELRPVLADLAAGLDAEPRWAGNALAMPNLGVQLHLEWTQGMRTVSLVSTGSRQSHQGWRRLEGALAGELSSLRVGRNPHAATLLAAAVILGTLLLVAVFREPQSVAVSLNGIERSVLEIGRTVRDALRLSQGA